MSIPFIPAPRSSLEWAESKRSGVVSELSLLTPIKPGLVPGERRTYEERLRDHLESLQLGDGRERGLLFMAANARITRQRRKRISARSSRSAGSGPLSDGNCATGLHEGRSKWQTG